jgi:hypothetical protein
MSAKAYLGDAVYVEVVDGMLKLTTEDGWVNPTNTIHLEPEVYAALQLYAAKVWQLPTEEKP